MFPEGNRRVLI